MSGPESPTVALAKRREGNPGSVRPALFEAMFPNRPDLHDKSVQLLAPTIGMHWRRLYRLLRGATRLRLEDAGIISSALAMTPLQLQAGIDRVSGVDATAREQVRYRQKMGALAAIQKVKGARIPTGLRAVWVRQVKEAQERGSQGGRTGDNEGT